MDPNRPFKRKADGELRTAQRSAKTKYQVSFENSPTEETQKRADIARGAHGSGSSGQNLETGHARMDDARDDSIDGEDDEEGRFFESGLSTRDEKVLDFIDNQESNIATDDLDWTESSLRKRVADLQKAIKKNEMLRSKYPDEPKKFLESEALLDERIQTFAALAEFPRLFGLAAKLQLFKLLATSIAHDNADIACDAIDVVRELTDEDVECSEQEASEIADAISAALLLDFAVQNLDRLVETNEAEQKGVFNTMNLFENIVSVDPERVAALSSFGKLVRWLLVRGSTPEKDVTSNKQYAMELLAIQCASIDQTTKLLLENDAIEVCLQSLAAYRKREPEKGSEKEQFVEDLIDVLCALVGKTEGKKMLLDAEGIELCLLVIESGKFMKQRVIKLLSHLEANSVDTDASERLIEAGGIRPLFSTFMKSRKPETRERIISIFASMLNFLPADSAPRIRLLAKFCEKSFEKTRVLIQEYERQQQRLRLADSLLLTTSADDDAEQLREIREANFDTRLEHGLAELQTTVLALSWLMLEDSGIQRVISEHVNKADLKAVLTEASEQISDNDTDATVVRFKEILTTLSSLL